MKEIGKTDIRAKKNVSKRTSKAPKLKIPNERTVLYISI
jgi:hypothetical protein